MTSPLFQFAAAVARNAAATVPTALVVPEAEKPPQKSPQTAETWLCYACDFEYVDGEDSCHNHLCPEGLGTVKASGWECAECGANDHPTGQCPNTATPDPEAYAVGGGEYTYTRQRVTERDYARAEAASAIVRAVRQWRDAKACATEQYQAATKVEGLRGAREYEAYLLDAVWQAGETLDALREEDFPRCPTDRPTQRRRHAHFAAVRTTNTRYTGGAGQRSPVMAYGSRFTTTATGNARKRDGSAPSDDSKCKNAPALRQASASTKAAAGTKISHTTGQRTSHASRVTSHA